MIKHFNIFVLLLMTLIASSGMAQNPNTPKHFLMPRELPYFEKQTKKDFIMFGFIQAGSISWRQDQTSYVITDGYESVVTVYKSWLEEGFFQDNEPVLVTGQMKDGVFEAHTILGLNAPRVCDYLIESVVIELNEVGFDINCSSPNS